MKIPLQSKTTASKSGSGVDMVQFVLSSTIASSVMVFMSSWTTELSVTVFVPNCTIDLNKSEIEEVKRA